MKVFSITIHQNDENALSFPLAFLTILSYFEYHFIFETYFRSKLTRLLFLLLILIVSRCSKRVGASGALARRSSRLARGESRHARLPHAAHAAHQRDARVQDTGVEFGARLRSLLGGQLVGQLAARRGHQRVQGAATDSRESETCAHELLLELH